MRDVERARTASPSRERRSQAERTAETRARIIAAVVEAIAEVGLQRTTATEIAGRAGVTWGAVQHHFGGKDGILVAVLEDSFSRFAERLADIPLAGSTLEQRASLFIDRAWAHFSSPHYRSTFEILLSYAGSEDAQPPSWQTHMLDAWNGVWRQLFGDARLSRRQHFVLQHYTISVLSGLASTRLLAGSETPIRNAELDLLKRTLSDGLERRA